MNNQNKNYQLTETFNPLIAAAKSILFLANSMQNSNSSLSVAGVLDKFYEMVNDFEQNAESNGATYELIKAAKYCLCTFVDETAVKAGWANEEWAKNSLLVTFFGETSGGERFFEILENAKNHPDKNLYLIEFIFICLQFGYKGKYRVLPNGDLNLEQIKSSLVEVINSKRSNGLNLLLNEKNETSNEINKKTKLSIPLWVLVSLFSLIVGVLFFVLNWSLGKKFNVTSELVNTLSLPKVIPYQLPVEDVKSARLRPQLIDEINRNLVEVVDLHDRSVVTIMGDGLFESGSESIQDKYFPVLATIGQALENTKGQVVVAGYTDNNPIQSLKFPSNWHLSQARADAVKVILLKYVSEEGRVRSEGRGSTNPVKANDSEENKARNRRVEITLFSTENLSDNENNVSLMNQLQSNREATEKRNIETSDLSDDIVLEKTKKNKE